MMSRSVAGSPTGSVPLHRELDLADALVETGHWISPSPFPIFFSPQLLCCQGRLSIVRRARGRSRGCTPPSVTDATLRGLTMARCWSSGFAAPWWTAAVSSGGSESGRGCWVSRDSGGRAGAGAEGGPGGAHLRLLGEPCLLRLLHGPFARPARGCPVGDLQGRAGQTIRSPVRCEDRLRAALQRMPTCCGWPTAASTRNGPNTSR